MIIEKKKNGFDSVKVIGALRKNSFGWILLGKPGWSGLNSEWGIVVIMKNISSLAVKREPRQKKGVKWMLGQEKKLRFI